MPNSVTSTAIAAIHLLGVVIIMAIYDTFFYAGNEELQLRAGECALNQFHIGDKVSDSGYENGVYLDVTGKGVVVIWGGIFVAAFGTDCLKDMWGNSIDFYRAAECTK